MNKLLIKGRYCTFENNTGKNIPIEQKRDVREDASWSTKGFPGSSKLDEQFDDIRYQHTVDDSVRITDNDIIRKQMGYPTHPVTQALLEAEFLYQIDSARTTNGRFNWLERVLYPRTTTNEYAPATLTKRQPLEKLTDDELFQKLFWMFKTFTNYGEVLEEHFRQNTGEDLHHNLEKWPDGLLTNKNKLVRVLKKKVIEAYKGNKTIDVTEDIHNNFLNFSSALLTMPGEAAAFGGIQQVEVLGFLLKEKRINNSRTTVLEAEFRFLIKDWFGADEEDIYKNDYATQIGRESLGALWVLQHQRGFKPFINVITYKERAEIIF